MRVLAVDTENQTYNKGSWSDARFKDVCHSWAMAGDSGSALNTEDSLERLRGRINQADLLVGFNAKYDVHVLRKIGVDTTGKRWWDCQIAEFILSNQTLRYPSLEGALIAHELGHKVDVVKTEYWDKGIQTDQIPWVTLEEYATTDAVKTLELFHTQRSIMSEAQSRLCSLMCMDMLILEEMEWNGITFNEELCRERAKTIEEEIRGITTQLSSIYPNVPINFGSGDQLSAFLYGGTIVEDSKEHVGFFKSGKQAGQPKYKNVEILHELPRLVTPLPRSELKKPGYWATNQDTLLKLKGNRKTKEIVELVQRQIRLDTLLSKTYNGIIKVNQEQMWEPGVLHGQLNQSVAQTGRLSASKPNQQNFDGEAADLFVSRYND